LLEVHVVCSEILRLYGDADQRLGRDIGWIVRVGYTTGTEVSFLQSIQTAFGLPSHLCNGCWTLPGVWRCSPGAFL